MRSSFARQCALSSVRMDTRRATVQSTRAERQCVTLPPAPEEAAEAVSGGHCRQASGVPYTLLPADARAHTRLPRPLLPAAPRLHGRPARPARARQGWKTRCAVGGRSRSGARWSIRATRTTRSSCSSQRRSRQARQRTAECCERGKAALRGRVAAAAGENEQLADERGQPSQS